MKVALINLWRVNNAKGGTEKVFFDLANALVSRGYSVKAITHDVKSGTPFFYMDPLVRYCNCGQRFSERVLHNSAVFKLCTSLIRSKKDRKIARAKLAMRKKSASISKEIKAFNPDVIVSFQQETTYMLLDVIGVSVPVVTMLHGDPEGYFTSAEFDLYKLSLEKSVIQVLMPEYVQQVLARLSPMDVVCIPNVVPQYSYNAPLDKPLIINVGRLDRVQKRQHLLIEAFNQLKNLFPEWKLEIWGETHFDSTYTREIEDLIEKNHLHGRVMLCQTTNNIAKELKRASIFGFPSSTEGFSLALGEAMSMGLPAVGCKSCPSVNTLIQNHVNGFLCQDTPDDIANKLSVLMKDDDLRKQMGMNATKSMKGYTADVVWEKWERLLRRLCVDSN